MLRAPTTDEVQRAIDSSWKAAGVNSASVPCVLQSVLVYAPGEELLPYAVVDAHGGNCFQSGPWKVVTVNRKAPAARDLMACRIGEIVAFGNDRLLVVARDGGDAPSIEACRTAMTMQVEVREHSQFMFSALAGIEVQLAALREALGRDRAGFCRYPDLEKAVTIIDAETEELAAFEAGLSELQGLPATRSIARLEADLAREASLLQSFRAELQVCLSRIDEALVEPRRRFAELERTRVSDEAVIRAEHARIEAAYHDILRCPLPITHDEAVAELEEITKLADHDRCDAFMLRRRLYILRVRCRHVLPGDGLLRGVLPDIEEEIHRLRRR